MSHDVPIKLIEIRKTSQFTQDQLAKLIGVGRQSFCDWENGYAKPRKARYDKIHYLWMNRYRINWDKLLKEVSLKYMPLIEYPPLPAKYTFRPKGMYMTKKKKKLIFDHSGAYKKED